MQIKFFAILGLVLMVAACSPGDVHTWSSFTPDYRAVVAHPTPAHPLVFTRSNTLTGGNEVYLTTRLYGPYRMTYDGAICEYHTIGLVCSERYSFLDHQLFGVPLPYQRFSAGYCGIDVPVYVVGVSMPSCQMTITGFAIGIHLSRGTTYRYHRRHHW